MHISIDVSLFTDARTMQVLRVVEKHVYVASLDIPCTIPCVDVSCEEDQGHQKSQCVFWSVFGACQNRLALCANARTMQVLRVVEKHVYVASLNPPCTISGVDVSC